MHPAAMLQLATVMASHITGRVHILQMIPCRRQRIVPLIRILFVVDQRRLSVPAQTHYRRRINTT